MVSQRRALVTGAAGFIGRTLGRHLKSADIESIAIARREAPKSYDDLIYSDLAVAPPRLRESRPDDTLIHLAALAHDRSASADDFRRQTVQLAANVAEAARQAGISRIVHVSSIGARIAETGDLAARTYGRAKLAAEQALLSLQEKSEVHVVTLRPPLVYGADAPGSFGMLRQLVLRGIPLPLGLANEPRDYLAVENLCNLLVHLCKLDSTRFAQLGGKTYEPSDGKAISTRDLCRQLGTLIGQKAHLLPIPWTFLRIAGALVGRRDQVDGAFSGLTVRDCPSLFEDAGWTPPQSFDEALARALIHA